MFNSIITRPKPEQTLPIVPILGDDSMEYVPVFSMNQPVIGSLRGTGPLNTFLMEELNTERPLDRLVLFNILKLNSGSYNNSGVNHIEELEILMEESFPHAINDYLKSSTRYEICKSSKVTGTYSDFFTYLTLNEWGIGRTSHFELKCNLHFCAEETRPGKIRPLFVLVTKPEFMEYLKLCWLLGETPEPSIFELWVDPEFDIVNSRWKYLRSKYQTLYKAKYITPNNIMIRKVPNIYEKLFYTIKTPETVKTIQDRKTWIEESAHITMQALKVKQTLQERNITLIH